MDRTETITCKGDLHGKFFELWEEAENQAEDEN
jgi:hypothetical protein